MRKENGIVVPNDGISPEALQRLLEEAVTRDGTDSGYTRLTLDEKVAQVRRQLERGDAVIVYDLAAESANIVLRRDLERSGQTARPDNPDRP